MKVRFSNRKSECSDDRANYYRKECEAVFFNTESELVLRDGKIYIKTDGLEKLLCEPDKVKTIWYETWLKLKARGL